MALGSLQWKAIAASVVIAASIILATALQIWTDYGETWARQEATAIDITKVVETHISNTVTQAENILELVSEMILQGNGTEHMREPSYWNRLNVYCESLLGCKSIAIVNPAGRIVALSETPDRPDIDASDRAYFKVPQQTKKLFIGPAVVTRIKGNPILFSIARPVYDAKGNLLAVVSAGISTNHVTDFYGLMGFTVNPLVSVFKSNGDIVARNPEMKKYVGRNNANGPLFTEHLPKAPSGTYISVSRLDGITRIAAYLSNPELDLVIFTGIEIPVALNMWQKRTIRTISIVGFLLLLILTVFYYSYKSLAQQLVLEKKNKELDLLSHHDSLTGVANRRQFDLTLPIEWSRHQREGTPLSLLVVDVDFFKNYNDNYGHQAGDKCLQQVAQALKSSLHRGVDLVARYGGEEFVVILHSDNQGAFIVAERMRMAVASLKISHAYSQAAPFLTVSIGMASTSSSKANSIARLLKEADDALYEVKERGRNQVLPKPTGPAILVA